MDFDAVSGEEFGLVVFARYQLLYVVIPAIRAACHARRIAKVSR